jgi:hypothetical protein
VPRLPGCQIERAPIPESRPPPDRRVPILARSLGPRSRAPAHRILPPIGSKRLPPPAGPAMARPAPAAPLCGNGNGRHASRKPPTDCASLPAPGYPAERAALRVETVESRHASASRLRSAFAASHDCSVTWTSGPTSAASPWTSLAPASRLTMPSSKRLTAGSEQNA